jgi:hypothetical protein
MEAKQQQQQPQQQQRGHTSVPLAQGMVTSNSTAGPAAAAETLPAGWQPSSNSQLAAHLRSCQPLRKRPRERWPAHRQAYDNWAPAYYHVCVSRRCSDVPATACK